MPMVLFTRKKNFEGLFVAQKLFNTELKLSNQSSQKSIWGLLWIKTELKKIYRHAERQLGKYSVRNIRQYIECTLR
jgi:hypothetical protein